MTKIQGHPAGVRTPRPPQLTQADLNRLVAFLHAVGAKPATVELSPGMLRIVTTDGQEQSSNSEDAELDAELLKHRERSRRTSSR